MVTNLGDDTLGDSALKNFESYGIDTRHVRRIPNQSTGTGTILVDAASGDNAILIVAGANGDLSSADVEAAGEELKRCDLILLQLEIKLETAYAAIRFGRRNGVKRACGECAVDGNRTNGAADVRPSSHGTGRNA
jgi:ribokinase